MIAPNLLHTAQKHCCVLYLTSGDELVILTGSHILSSSPQIFYLQTSSFSFPLLCSYSRLTPRSSSFSPPSPLPAPIPCYPLPTTASTRTSPPSPLLTKIQPSKSEDLIGFIQPFINWEASHLENRRALWKAVKWLQLCGSLNILWDWLENWPFPILWPLLSFPYLQAALSQHQHLGFEIAQLGIPSPPRALFVVMLLKARFTLHSRMSGSRWMITPLWLSEPLRSFCIVLCILTTSS